jgi:hypothetical protein
MRSPGEKDCSVSKKPPDSLIPCVELQLSSSSTGSASRNRYASLLSPLVCALPNLITPSTPPCPLPECITTPNSGVLDRRPARLSLSEKPVPRAGHPHAVPPSRLRRYTPHHTPAPAVRVPARAGQSRGVWQQTASHLAHHAATAVRRDHQRCRWSALWHSMSLRIPAPGGIPSAAHVLR